MARKKKFKFEWWHLVLGVLFIIIAMKSPTFFGAVYTPSTTVLELTSIDSIEVPDTFFNPKDDTAIAKLQFGKVPLNIGCHLLVYEYPDATINKLCSIENPAQLGLSYTYKQIEIVEGGFINLTYDGGNSLLLYFPKLGVGSSGFGELYFSDDGSSYYDAELTNLAFAAPGPEQQCIESWSCTQWSDCIDNQQTRSCTDVNACGTILNKPSEVNSCSIEECVEEWDCTVFGDCECVGGCKEVYQGNNPPCLTITNKQDCINYGDCYWEEQVCEQTRTCEDLNMCDTSENKPNLVQACEPDCNPITEVCDGLDNDCDGEIDEDNVCGICTEGETKQCGVSDLGECSYGTQTCTDGQWNDCVGNVNPVDEVCDGLDNDCDNNIDEGVLNSCVNYDDCTVYQTCEECLAPPYESCNGIDDDCNGVVDEGVTNSCVDYTTCLLYNSCDSCDSEPDEICDGLDNNCDGTTDEGCVCTTGQTQECGVTNIGECSYGTQSCSAGTWGSCSGNIDPVEEICDDNKDNDCDGEIDEGCILGCQSDEDCSDGDISTQDSCVDNECVYANRNIESFWEENKQIIMIGGGIILALLILSWFVPRK